MNWYLQEDLKKYFSESSPLFDQMMALRGECFRHREGRLTQRIALGGKTYFIKQHRGIGWKEILKNWLQARWPVLSAKNEWRALEKLRLAGVAVPRVVGYGLRGVNPARLQSFILLEDVSPSTSLEDLCRYWQAAAPVFLYKKTLMTEVARVARVMHHMGINHRDFYICHFLLKEERLYLIDLHRAQMRAETPWRWQIKDLAGLYFSSKECGLTKRDLYRFMQVYTQKSLRDILKTESDYWLKVKNRGEKLYRDHAKR